MWKVLVVDDHPLFRDALKTALAVAFDASETVEASSLDEAVEAVRRAPDLDLALLDLNMPGSSGFSGLLALRAQFPALPIVVVSAFEERRLMRQAIDYGAVGFIPKSTPRDGICGALRRIVAGEVYTPPALEQEDPRSDEEADVARRIATLTAQQLRVLELLGTGKLNKEIAYELNIAETTVKAHVSAILQKLKVYSRTQAVVFASKLKFDNLAQDVHP
jgi:DNA-binding NarL/FixJ family response regulator